MTSEKPRQGIVRRIYGRAVASKDSARQTSVRVQNGRPIGRRAR